MHTQRNLQQCPLSGFPDRPENYHTVTIELSGEGEYTRVSLSQDNNLTAESRDHSRRNWEVVLTGLKKVLESDVIKGLFAEYEKAFAALDFEKSAGFFSDTFISACPVAPLRRARPNF